MPGEPGPTVAKLEAREGELVEGNGGKPAERHRQRVVVEDGHAQQGHSKQDKINGDAEKVARLRSAVADRRPAGKAKHDEKDQTRSGRSGSPGGSGRSWPSRACRAVAYDPIRIFRHWTSPDPHSPTLTDGGERAKLELTGRCRPGEGFVGAAPHPR